MMEFHIPAKNKKNIIEQDQCHSDSLFLSQVSSEMLHNDLSSLDFTQVPCLKANHPSLERWHVSSEHVIRMLQ